MVDLAMLKHRIENGGFKFYSHRIGDTVTNAKITGLEFENYKGNVILRINGEAPNGRSYTTKKFSARFNLSKTANIIDGMRHLTVVAPAFYQGVQEPSPIYFSQVCTY